MSAKKKVQKQMEFYLSPSNLRQDKFLQQKMQLHDDGFIEIDVFLSFNRIKSLGATTRMLTEAIQKSSMLILNDAKTHVRPRELPAAGEDDSLVRTIYIENFPCGSDHDSLRRMFAPFGKVNLVSMPRFPGSQKFKGFAFVEFAAPETVDAVLSVLKQPPRDGHPDLAGIKGMTKSKWLQLRNSLKERMHHNSAQTTSGTLRQAVEAAAKAPGANVDFFTRGLLIQLSNIPADTSRKEIKGALEAVAPVAFLDDAKLKFGGDIAFARFLSTSHAQRVLDTFKRAPLTLKGNDIVIDLVTGESEVAYWTALVNHAAKATEASCTPAQTKLPKTPPTTTHVLFDDSDEAAPKRQKLVH
ncbi:hypothetical protein H310_06662 [Aphanomyces invadans]|uniref:HTH La-type RNA-binding domain-containing protein n=1 Tax=Aphanomyces invadans TaxID=157072 RepID=A0A024U462_9STRA|nr:hypothetical protein H310_06662 [Aphanomyces invadans]ETW01029.1 hypothetical protein H310_06662 [Aphanomyces invadans]|eukprot:XP_008870027.1 hypothetical protein H310_06662 [Aphanomyces invadans]